MNTEQIDPILLGAARRNAWGKLRSEDPKVVGAIYKLFQLIDHPKQAIYLAATLPNFVKEGATLSEEQIARYSLCGLRVSRYHTIGHDDYWSRRRVNGYSYDLCMDV